MITQDDITQNTMTIKKMHNEDNFETWYKENQVFLAYYSITEETARLIFDAGRISALNHYITLISNGDLIVP